jgi:hypothetical protein
VLKGLEKHAQSQAARGRPQLDPGLSVDSTRALSTVFGTGMRTTAANSGDISITDPHFGNEGTGNVIQDNHSPQIEPGGLVCEQLRQLFAACLLGLQTNFDALEQVFTSRMARHGSIPVSSQGPIHDQGAAGAREGNEDAHINPSTDFKNFILSKQKYILDGFMEFTARIISVVTRLYKILGRMVKYYCTLKLRSTRPALVALLRFVCTSVSPQIHAFLLTNVYNVSSSGKKRNSTASGSAPSVAVAASRTAKCERRIPDLIFQMEQLDVLVIRLTGMVVDKYSLSGIIRRTAARDFRIFPRAQQQQQQAVSGGESMH